MGLWDALRAIAGCSEHTDGCFVPWGDQQIDTITQQCLAGVAVGESTVEELQEAANDLSYDGTARAGFQEAVDLIHQAKALKADLDERRKK